MSWRMLDLFTGLGGFTRAAHEVWGDELETVSFVEIDGRCREFLARAWPGIPIHDDIKTFTLDTLIEACWERLSPEQKETINMGIEHRNYDQAVSLYESGLSIGSIAEYYGITRQAMWMILKRRGCHFRSNLKYGSENHFYRGGSKAPDRIHNLTELAIEKGILVRPGSCEKCGKSNDTICSHHDDYNKPLEVTWLCIPCHFEWHRNNKPKELTIAFPSMPREEICRMGGKASASRLSPLQRKARTYKAISARYGKEVMPDELRRELEAATNVDILTAGVP